MTDISLGLPEVSPKKPFFKDARNYIAGVTLAAVVGYMGAATVNDYVIGDKDDLLCNQIRTEFAQAAKSIPTLLPTDNNREVSMSMSVVMPADEIGSFIPWATRECTIL